MVPSIARAVRAFGLLCLLGAAWLPARPRARAIAQGGLTESLELAHRAFDVPEGAPTLVAHAAADLPETGPLELVLFLHGWSGCVNVLVRSGPTACIAGGPLEQGWGLGEAHDRAGRRSSVLLAPQLAYRTRDGHPGRLARQGYADAMIREALERLAGPLHGRGLDDVSRITVVAHSAAFESALAVLRRGGLGERVRRVVLFDALYDAPSAFAAWALEDPSRSLVSLHTGVGRTLDRNQRLVAALRARLSSSELAVDPPDLAAAVRTHRVVVARTRAGHGQVPARHFPDVLAE
ncbi:MAG: hypothetical protein U0230_05800 [Polyangiales bacterium]